MGHSEGICHVYIDKAADPTKAAEVAVDAKVPRLEGGLFCLYEILATLLGAFGPFTTSRTGHGEEKEFYDVDVSDWYQRRRGRW